MPTRQSTNRSVERALDILDCFVSGDKLMLTEIAKEVELPVSTTYRLVRALEDRRLLKRGDDSRQFSLGEKIGDLLYAYVGGRFDLLRCAAMHSMEALSVKYNETVRLFVRDGGYKLCIEAVESTRDLRHIVKIGERHDLLRGAAGKVLLAYMPQTQRQAVLNGQNLDGNTNKVLSDGYAVSFGEREEGLAGIAAPIFFGAQQVIATVSLSGPAARFTQEMLPQKIADTLSCARQITKNMTELQHHTADDNTS